MFVTMTRSINKTTTQRNHWVSKRPIALWFQQSRITLRKSSNTLTSWLFAYIVTTIVSWMSFSCFVLRTLLFPVTVTLNKREYPVQTNVQTEADTRERIVNQGTTKEWIALYFDRIAIILIKKSCSYPRALHCTNLWFLTHHSRLHRVCLWTGGAAASWFWRQWRIELLRQWDIEKSGSDAATYWDSEAVSGYRQVFFTRSTELRAVRGVVSTMQRRSPPWRWGLSFARWVNCMSLTRSNNTGRPCCKQCDQVWEHQKGSCKGTCRCSPNGA